MKSLAILGMTAALNRPEEFRVHMNGALTNGCTPDEIREILLLVAVYCGIPAANEAHRIAYETINARKSAQP
ncbi:MAG: carboxymuconolactone decarboxylase family protein, partial [Burkholderiales bacterium]